MYDKIFVLLTVVGVSVVSAKAQLFAQSTPNGYLTNPTAAPVTFPPFGANVAVQGQRYPTLRDFSNVPFGEYATSNPFQQHGAYDCSLCKRKLNSTDDEVRIGSPKQFSQEFPQSVTSTLPNSSDSLNFGFNEPSFPTSDASSSGQQIPESSAQNSALHRENVAIISSDPNPNSQNLQTSTAPSLLEQNTRSYLPMTSSKSELVSGSSSQQTSEESESTSSIKPSYSTSNSLQNSLKPVDTGLPEISVRFGAESSTSKPYGALAQAQSPYNPLSYVPQSTGIPYTPPAQPYSSNGFLGSPNFLAGIPKTQVYSPFSNTYPYPTGISNQAFAQGYSPYGFSNFSPYTSNSVYSAPSGFNGIGFNPALSAPNNVPVYSNSYSTNGRIVYPGQSQIPSNYPFGYNSNTFYQNTASPPLFNYQNSNFNSAQASPTSTPFVSQPFNAGQSSFPQTLGGSGFLNNGAPRPGFSNFGSPTTYTQTYSGALPYSVPDLRQSSFVSSTAATPTYSSSPYSTPSLVQSGYPSSTAATPTYSTALGLPQVNYNGQPAQ
ncbi:uncharacterized protein LOC101736296 [Bombyx mori]|uniref:Uncharacterized protein n=1 Tax=Bombyx mori TaxID=7091 RepID=A0A8R1WP85_BOMMO|nr:putative GPI-anchored protein pfl2 [Bombyx mori]